VEHDFKVYGRPSHWVTGHSEMKVRFSHEPDETIEKIVNSVTARGGNFRIEAADEYVRDTWTFTEIDGAPFEWRTKFFLGKRALKSKSYQRDLAAEWVWLFDIELEKVNLLSFI
jgi:hypothetical protein